MLRSDRFHKRLWLVALVVIAATTAWRAFWWLISLAHGD
jgi:hypothetical protein